MAGVELRGVVDEDEAAAPRGRQDPNAPKNDMDWDNIFAYSTDKVVRIYDFKLGILYWSIVTIIILYMLIVVFNIEARQMVELPGYGTTIARFRGKALANGKIYDEADLRFPVIEPTGAFIMTKRIVVSQKRGRCVDMDFPSPCPCRSGDRCVDGFCETSGWCPSLGEANAHAPPAGAKVERFEGLAAGLFQIMSSIYYPHFSEELFIQGEAPGASNLYRNITVDTLVDQAEPKIKLADVFEKGALLTVSTQWTCNVRDEFCDPIVQVKSLDGGAGFSQKRAIHFKKDGEETRDAIYMYGLRILIDSAGSGKRTSMTLIVIQIGSGIALLRTASMIADSVMLYMYGPDRRKAYYKCKVQETKDYSDLQDRVNLIREHNEAKATLMGTPKTGTSSGLVARGGAAGSRVPLGLGPGARGGSARVLTRGREL